MKRHTAYFSVLGTVLPALSAAGAVHANSAVQTQLAAE